MLLATCNYGINWWCISSSILLYIYIPRAILLQWWEVLFESEHLFDINVKATFQSPWLIIDVRLDMSWCGDQKSASHNSTYILTSKYRPSSWSYVKKVHWRPTWLHHYILLTLTVLAMPITLNETQVWGRIILICSPLHYLFSTRKISPSFSNYDSSP